MKLTDSCYTCLKGLVIHVAGLAAGDETSRIKVEEAGIRMLDEEFSTEKPSIIVATKIHDEIKKVSGNPDPYRSVKNREIELARSLFNELKVNYNNHLKDVLKLSVVGNSMDFFKPLETVHKKEMTGAIEFYIDDTNKLESQLKNTKKILYLADNAGEVYFDLPLVNYMKRFARVIYAVKARPVQNDITLDDVKRAGVEKELGEIIDTGTATPGVIFSQASDVFLREFETADIVFSKGMANYESLSELPQEGRFCYCFKAKCGPVADSVGVPVNSFVNMFK